MHWKPIGLFRSIWLGDELKLYKIKGTRPSPQSDRPNPIAPIPLSQRSYGKT
jgi:hypothetical protein